MSQFHQQAMEKCSTGNSTRIVLALAVAALVLGARPAHPSPLDVPAVQQGAAAEVPADLPALKPAGSAEDPLAWDAPAAPAPVAEAAPAAPVVEEVVPAAPPAAEPEKPVKKETASPQNTDLQGKVNMLERRVVALEDAVSALKVDAGTVGAGRKAVSPDVLPDRPLATKIRKVKARKKHAPAAAAHQWVLKGAKPGTAWLAEKGSSALRTVTIGDTLPGLGKITAVAKDSSGVWVVNGTGGRISQ